MNYLISIEDVKNYNIDEFVVKTFSQLDILDSSKKDYAYFAKDFILFIQKNGLSINSFREYKHVLSNNNSITVSTKNKYLTSARILLKEFNRDGLIPVDITHNTKSFKQSKKHKKEGLSECEIQTLAIYLQELKQNKRNTRVKALISLLIFQGLRQCEIVRLNRTDIDLVQKIAMIRTKGADDTEPVYLHPVVVRELEKYIRINKVADGPLFVSWSNNNLNNRLTTNTVRMLVKETLSILDIHKSVHGFRHYFTTKLIKTYKGDLLEVARYTRHKSLEMLQVYNDNVKTKADLPRFYNAFSDVNLDKNVR